MDDREQKIEKLKEYFANRDDVVLAFLFGSQAKGRARRVSDWDVGVYLTEENREREREIWGDIERLLDVNTDLIILNRAPASVAWSVVRTGLPLAIRSRRVYLDFMLSVSHEANAWYKTSRDYHRVFERSASLSEEDRERLRRAVQFLVTESVDFKKFQKLSWEEYAQERPKQREVERWAEQLMNAVINIAEIVLASERRVIPETYHMMVQTLGTVDPFGADDLCGRLAAWTGLRNLLAHEYLDYRWKELAPFIRDAEPLFTLLIERLRAFLERAPHSA